MSKRTQAKQSRINNIKLGAFAASMLTVLGGLGVVFGEVRSGSTHAYQAVFADVSGLREGDKVRVAGVEVGRVTGVSLIDDGSQGPVNSAMVSFEVDDALSLNESSETIVKYANLTGDRYMEISRGEATGNQLQPGGRLPVEQSVPALDLDDLLGGFKPLFNAMDPEQINTLSTSIVQVMQGEAGTVQSLMATTNSLTNTIADKDQVISDVVANLNRVLKTTEERSDNVDDIVDNLQQLISGLAQDAAPLGNSVQRISDASSSLSGLLSDVRPALKTDVQKLDAIGAVFQQDEANVDRILKRLPTDFQKMSRLGAYGGMFNFYLCGVVVKLTDPATNRTLYMPNYEQRTGRCSPP